MLGAVFGREFTTAVWKRLKSLSLSLSEPSVDQPCSVYNFNWRQNENRIKSNVVCVFNWKKTTLNSRKVMISHLNQNFKHTHVRREMWDFEFLCGHVNVTCSTYTWNVRDSWNWKSQSLPKTETFAKATNLRYFKCGQVTYFQ